MSEPRYNYYRCIRADPPWDWHSYSGKDKDAAPQPTTTPCPSTKLRPCRWVYACIEALVDGPYIELFGRQRRAGWDAYGREIDTGIGKRRWRNSFPGASL